MSKPPASSFHHSGTSESKPPPDLVSPTTESSKRKWEGKNDMTSRVSDLNLVVNTKIDEASTDVKKNTQKNTSRCLIAIANKDTQENITWVFQDREAKTVTTGKIN